MRAQEAEAKIQADRAAKKRRRPEGSTEIVLVIQVFATSFRHKRRRAPEARRETMFGVGVSGERETSRGEPMRVPGVGPMALGGLVGRAQRVGRGVVKSVGDVGGWDRRRPDAHVRHERTHVRIHRRASRRHRQRRCARPPPPPPPPFPPATDRRGGRARHRSPRARECARWPRELLTDTHGRHHSYLRISLTEKCNLAVSVLHARGRHRSDRERPADDHRRGGARREAVRRRGGEQDPPSPAANPRCGATWRTSADSAALEGLNTIAVTTNGLTLHRRLGALRDAGLTHVNISLDTLVPAKFELLTRRGATTA